MCLSLGGMIVEWLWKDISNVYVRVYTYMNGSGEMKSNPYCSYFPEYDIIVPWFTTFYSLSNKMLHSS